MSGHTPGPWKHDGQGLKVFAESMNVCDIRGWGHLTGKGGGLALPEDTAIAIQTANAQLIAAAPELLDAARLAVDAIGNTRDDFGLKIQLEKAYLELRAAIAKAEGS